MRLASARALIWIAIKLVGSDEHRCRRYTAGGKLVRAVRIVVVRRHVMGSTKSRGSRPCQGEMCLGSALRSAFRVVFAGSAIVWPLLGALRLVWREAGPCPRLGAGRIVRPRLGDGFPT